MHSRINYFFLLTLFTLPFHTIAGEFPSARNDNRKAIAERITWLTNEEMLACDDSKSPAFNIIATGIVSGIGAGLGGLTGFVVGPVGAAMGAKVGASLGGVLGIWDVNKMDKINREKAKNERIAKRTTPLEIEFVHGLYQPSQEAYAAYQAFKRDEAPLVISRPNFKAAAQIDDLANRLSRGLPTLARTIIEAQQVRALTNLDHIDLLNRTINLEDDNADGERIIDKLKNNKEICTFIENLQNLMIAHKCYAQGSELTRGVSGLIAYISVTSQLASALTLVEEIDALKNSHQKTDNALINANAELDELRHNNTDNDELVEMYRNRVIKMATENRDTKELLEKKQIETESLKEDFAQRSVQAAQEFMAVRSQLSPARARAEQVSPLRRQVTEKDTEIAELKRQLEEARKNMWHTSNDAAFDGAGNTNSHN